MNDKYQMSPLAQVLVGILGKGTWVAGVLLVGFAGILLFQRMTPEGSIQFLDGDVAFLVVIAVLLALAIYLVRAFKKEMNNPGG